jgi:ectoine hydroxylase-related dioxygenase (phytanoyl-CoA dioxygenase family)
MKSYGIDNISSELNELEQHLENISRKGLSVKENLFSVEECDLFIQKVITVYHKQEKDLGAENLQTINELNLARMPFLDDLDFSKLFLHPYIIQIMKAVLGNFFEINLQNAIINKPNLEHHQSSWHRDLPYQDWVISKPIALNAFVCLTDFTNETGGTYFLPYSQKSSHFPSIEFAENEKIQFHLPKGSVIFFDSMVFHKAGYNSSNKDRIGVNNMFTVPILKSQVENSFLSDSEELAQFTVEEKSILGVNFKTTKSVHELRTKKLNTSK